MIVSLVGKLKRKIAVELSINDMLIMVGSAKRRLENPNKSTADHVVAAGEVELLEREIFSSLSAQGFADPVFIAECLGSEVQDVLTAIDALDAKRKAMRASPTAYYSAKALRFDETHEPPLTWPGYNPSSDAP